MHVDNGALTTVSAEGVKLRITRRRIGPTTALLLCGLALVVMVFLAAGIGVLVSRRYVRAELARIRAAGEPVTPTDLEAFYSLPPGSRDTTELWLEVCDALTGPAYTSEASDLPRTVQELPQPDEPWPVQAAMERFLAKHAELLAKIHEVAVIRGAARYPTDFAGHMGAMLKSATGLALAARLLTSECEVHIRNGDSHAASESLRAIFASARTLDVAPVELAQLIRISGDEAAIGCLERLLATVDLPDDDLAAMDADLAAIDYYPQFHRALLGERVMALSIFDDPGQLGDQAQHAGSTLFRDADRATYLQIARETVAASADKDQLSLRAAIKEIDGRTRKAFESPMASWRYPITKITVPSTEFLDSVGRATAIRDVARTAIAVERFRRTNGQLPVSLGDLTPNFLPQLPIDPFSGAPLHWAVSGEDCRIYSVGLDGVDQGGSVEETITRGDIVFRLPRHRAREKSSVSE